jgi:toxin FitB
VSGWLLDTNVISELARPKPAKQVRTFMGNLEGESFLSVITLHEVDYGIACLPDGKRKREIEQWLEELEQKFAEFILPVARRAARHAAWLRRQAQQRGRVIHLADALIAGTAIDRGLQLVTRNTSDFEGSGARLVNPWMDSE